MKFLSETKGSIKLDSECEGIAKDRRPDPGVKIVGIDRADHVEWIGEETAVEQRLERGDRRIQGRAAKVKLLLANVEGGLIGGGQQILWRT